MTADWVAALVAAAAAAEGRVAADGRVMTPDWAAASAEGGGIWHQQQAKPWSRPS